MAEEMIEQVRETVRNLQEDIREIRKSQKVNEKMLWGVIVFLAAQFGFDFLRSVGFGFITGMM